MEGVDLLDVGQAVFTQQLDRDMGLLTEWSLREGHLELRRNLRAMYLGLYAAEMMGLLFEEHDPNPEMFDRLESTLAELATARVEEMFLAFELDLLRQSGYLPELGGCVNCGLMIGSREAVWFSPERGGIVCQNCQGIVTDRFSFDPRLLAMLQTLLKLPKANGVVQRLPRLTRHQTDPINRILGRHLGHTLGKRLRMTSYVVP